jgi:biopolymer transport protein ExbB
MSFELSHIWASMGLFSRLIAGGLLLMGIAALGVFFERAYVLFRNLRASRRFASQAAPLLDDGDFDHVLAMARKETGSHLASVVAATLTAYTQTRRGSKLPPEERARRELARELEQGGQQLRRGLNMLASIGSIAPFVGLLGTVVGIITAFQGIAASGSGGLAAVSSGISEALVETALGLCVAIPAVAIFNALSGHIDEFEMSLQQAGSRLIDTLEEQHHAERRQQQAA